MFAIKSIDLRTGVLRKGGVILLPLRLPRGEPSHTPSVVLRPSSSSVLRKRGRYPHPLREPRRGEASAYTRDRLSPPTPGNRIKFVQVGFFGCTLVSHTGFFGCKHHHTKFTKIITKTRKLIRLGYRQIHVVPSPVPQHQNPQNSTKITKRGTGVEKWKEIKCAHQEMYC